MCKRRCLAPLGTETDSLERAIRCKGFFSEWYIAVAVAIGDDAVAEQLRAYLRANGGSALGTELTEFYRQITPRAREVIRSAHAPTQNNSGVKSLVLLHPDLMRMENGDAGRIFALP